MSISQIRNPQSVLFAIAEYDAIGSIAFLRKYGFGEAREYFLFHNGRRYDSKAIIGAAYGYEYPDQGPLRSQDFSGGESTVRRKLEELGFSVLRASEDSGSIKLRLYEAYSRENVHDLFDSNSKFTPQTGKWGLSGIISLPNRPGDFVFFVSLGKKEGDHTYRDAISRDGVLAWDSQRKQGLDHREVRQFIRHDETRNSIYLFVRPRPSGPYTYVGLLKYLWHDSASAHPVHFNWQILNWNTEIARHLGFPFSGGDIPPQRLSLVSKPEHSPKHNRRRPSRKGVANIDYAAHEARNRALGTAGEKLVVLHEKEFLIAHGREHLANNVEHVSETKGDGLGYDVRSFTLDGSPKYIEVKTSRGGIETPFFLTRNELEVSREYSEHYYLYRVFHYSHVSNSGSFFILRPPLEDTLLLTATEYKAVPH